MASLAGRRRPPAGSHELSVVAAWLRSMTRFWKAFKHARSVTLGAPTLEAEPSRPHKLAQRLASEVIEQIILGLLKCHEVSRRRTKITYEQVDQALQLFHQGHSVAKAAQQLGLAPTTE